MSVFTNRNEQVLSASQNPVIDETHRTVTTVGASSGLVLTPPAGCEGSYFETNADVYLHTAGGPAVNGIGLRVIANQPPIWYPVIAGVGVYAIAGSDTASLRCTPTMDRP